MFLAHCFLFFLFGPCFAAHFVESAFVSLTNSTASAGGAQESVMVVHVRRHNRLRRGTYFELGAMPKLAQKYASQREFAKSKVILGKVCFVTYLPYLGT